MAQGRTEPELHLPRPGRKPGHHRRNQLVERRRVPQPVPHPHIRHERPVVFGTEIQQPAPHARPLFQERPAHFAQQQRIRRGNARQGTETAQPPTSATDATTSRVTCPPKRRTKAVTPAATSTTTRVSPARIRSTTNYAPRAATTSTCWADTQHRSSTTTT